MVSVGRDQHRLSTNGIRTWLCAKQWPVVMQLVAKEASATATKELQFQRLQDLVPHLTHSFYRLRFSRVLLFRRFGHSANTTSSDDNSAVSS
jgi:hypothetical protein